MDRHRRAVAVAVALGALGGACGDSTGKAPPPKAGLDGGVLRPLYLVEAARMVVKLELPWPVMGVEGKHQGISRWRFYTRTGVERKPGIPDVTVEVLSAPSFDLDAWARYRPPPTGSSYGQITETTVCGRPARRREIAVPPHERRVELTDEDANHEVRIEQMEASVIVVVATRHADQDVVLSWDVPVSARDQARAGESAFFSTVSCI